MHNKSFVILILVFFLSAFPVILRESKSQENKKVIAAGKITAEHKKEDKKQVKEQTHKSKPNENLSNNLKKESAKKEEISIIKWLEDKNNPSDLIKKLKEEKKDLKDLDGAKLFIKDKKEMPLEISLQEISSVEKIKNKNLTLKISESNKKIAEEAEKQKDSYFDSIFNFKIGLSHTDSNGRYEHFIGRSYYQDPADTPPSGTASDYLDTSQQYDSLNDSSYSKEMGETGSISPIGVIKEGDEVIFDSSINSAIDEYLYKDELDHFASSDSHPKFFPAFWSGGIGYYKNFEYGQSLNVNFSSFYSDRYKPGLGKLSVLYTYDKNYAYENTPWASSLSFKLTTPLPYCKNFRGFGEEGSFQYVSKEIATKNKERWAIQEEFDANNVLRDVQFAYWDLVYNFAKVYVITEHRKNLEKISGGISKDLKDGIRLKYDSWQAEAKVSNIKSMEEIAWANLVTSSNYLADLLGQNKDSIIIPKNFSQYLNKTYKMPEKVFEKAQERQDKQMSILDKNINSLLVKYRENQEKPDLTLSINCNLAQDPTYFAYPTITESLSKLFKPDNSYFYIGIDYKLPIGNNAASAALCQARIRERQSEIKIKNQESQINQEVNIAISNFKSSEFQISKTKENLKLRQNIFDEAHSLSRTKDTNIFEYLKKYDELLDAELAYLDALISYQKAHVNLQATQGILAKKGN